VTTLTNAPTVPSASAIASQVRSELSVELGRVDAAVSSRATAANIPAADITAIKAKTDSLNVDRINNTATTAIVGNLLAQANS
jgi:antitoxin (DNA-binding transcriptional repressor) of toxin-antitoxin stability system